MQLLLNKSEEYGNHSGLGFINGEVVSFKNENLNLPIPHMGWNDVEISKKSIFYKEGVVQNFYFVHGFYCKVEDPQTNTGSCHYGIKFCAMVERENVFGCQFHPEKSQKFGMEIYKRFNEL
jgi:glutamine amidotransferase